MEYDFSKLSSLVRNIRIIDVNKGTIEVAFHSSKESYRYTNLELEKLLDIDRSFSRLNKRQSDGKLTDSYRSKWSVGKYLNREIMNDKKYKVK